MADPHASQALPIDVADKPGAIENEPAQDLHPDAGNHEPATNFTGNPRFASVLEGRYSRRQVLHGGLSTALAALFATPALSAFAASGLLPPQARGKPPFAAKGELGFQPISVYTGDATSIAPGYTARPFLVAGEPIIGPDVGNPAANSVAAFENCSGAEMEQRVGSHHDGMHYFPFPDDPNNHGVLCFNHEYIDPQKLFPAGTYVSSGMRPADQVRKGVAAHGVTVVEIARGAEGEWQVVPGPLNRRITAETRMELTGPVRGSAHLRTKYSPAGTHTRGTLNNCAHGTTPWHSYLTCEENWASYFAAGSQASRREFRRVGVGANSGRYGWDMADSEPTASPSNPDPYRRFAAGAHLGADASEDYRNEPNGQGWVVEIDPWDPDSTPAKHTAMGRFPHEGCVPAPAQEGQPLAFYSGDDAVNQYMYKFVTAARYHKNRADGSMLDAGTLYVAKFHGNGRGEWLPLDFDDPGFQAAIARAKADPRSVWPVGHYDDFDGFQDQADVLVNTRLAADIAGATPMDRPEWCAVHPQTNEVYLALTNNSSRGGNATSNGNPVPAPVDAANPRPASQFGHIIRWREQGNRPWALKFDWDLFVLSGPADDSLDLAGNPLTPDNIHASADGLWIDNRGILWIQTDMGSGQQVVEHDRFGNNQMLAANPYTGEIRRFFQGPRGQEVTGVIDTPDGRTLFINLQHPGEGSESNALLASSFPDGPSSGGRGRSCTLIISKDDGGVIGS